MLIYIFIFFFFFTPYLIWCKLGPILQGTHATHCNHLRGTEIKYGTGGCLITASSHIAFDHIGPHRTAPALHRIVSALHIVPHRSVPMRLPQAASAASVLPGIFYVYVCVSLYGGGGGSLGGGCVPKSPSKLL